MSALYLSSRGRSLLRRQFGLSWWPQPENMHYLAQRLSAHESCEVIAWRGVGPQLFAELSAWLESHGLHFADHYIPAYIGPKR